MFPANTDLGGISGAKGLQMKLCDLFKEIESTRFQSRYMLFSGFKLVRKALSRDSTVGSLINEVRLNPSYASAVGERIVKLYAKHVDDAGSTFDIAVAAYLFCLYRTSQDLARVLSGYILEMGKLWWSVDLALHVRRNMELFNEPSKRNFNISGYATSMEDVSWPPRVVQRPTYEAILVGINGEELCNISGQFSVRSPQKTRTRMLSV